MAAGDVYFLAGTPVVWRDTGGQAMSLSSLASANAREGVRYDWGAGAKPAFFRWTARTQFAVAPTIQTGLEIHFGLWDDESGVADAWGGLAGTDSAYTTAAGIAKRESLTFAGIVHAETSAVGPFIKGGYLYQPARYMSPFATNSSNQALASSGTYASLIRVTPYYAQVQA
jgi:hypothetical protein